MDTDSDINIWSDLWVPSSPSRKANPKGAIMLSKVEELTNPGLWDEMLIRDLFSPVDAQHILQIPFECASY